MSNTPYVRAALAQAALEFVPPLIRLSLVDNTEFKAEYGLSAEVELAIGDPAVSMQRSHLFNAVRQTLKNGVATEVTDTCGRDWRVTNEAEAGQLPQVRLSSGQETLLLPDLAILSPDVGVRLRSLETVAVEVNLPITSQDTWREVLEERSLEDHEVDLLRKDVHDTPIHVAAQIRQEIIRGVSSASSLVPCSRRYFERLVGVYDGSKSIFDYADCAERNVLEPLSVWRPYEGFMIGLFLSSHSSLTAKSSVNRLSGEELTQCYEYLVTHGDVLSRLGAIEVGLRILPDNREIEPFVVHLIKQIRDDDIDGTSSSFKLLAGLVVLVDGELSMTRLMCSAPPFYRRLVSLSHASLIYRQLMHYKINYEQFYDWALNSSAEQYYMQSLSDMRVEPRWNPELAGPRQLKAECCGRIILAASALESSIKDTDIHDLILGSDPRSLFSLCKFPDPYLPGPLEGTEVIRNVLPSDLAEIIEAQVTGEPVEPSSFIALVNSAMIFGTDSAHVKLAATALRLGDHRLRNVESKSDLLVVLMGLAKVAAAARSTELADELRILMRTYEPDGAYSLSISEKLSICLIAAASRADLTEWRNFVGEWLTELAFGQLGVEEAKVFHSRLQSLCHAVPELWVSCARADAALIAFNEC